MTERKENESTGALRQQAERAEQLQQTIAPEAAVVARPVRRYRARIFQAYLVAATLVFGLLLYYARHVAYFGFDLSIARWLQGQHRFWLDVLMYAVSELGFNPLAGWFVCLTILFVFLVKLKWEAIMLLVTGVGIGLLDTGFKMLAHRSRPAADLVNVVWPIRDYSFPSGHVLLFTVFLGFLLFLIYTLTPRSWARTIGLSLLGVLIALVGVSRVYMGQHWPSDVVGAYLLGSLWLTVTVYFYRKGQKRFFVREPRDPGTP